MTVASTVSLAAGLSRAFLHHHRVCPTGLDVEGALLVAVGPHAARAALGDLATAYDRDVRTREVDDAELDRLIERLASPRNEGLELAVADDSPDSTTDIRDLAQQAPVVRYVNQLVREAFEAGASDIHLESTRGDLVARFRLDGVLQPAPSPPLHLQHAVVSRVKLLADLDIAERRRPQDGRIRVKTEERELDLRVATIPTLHGESVVLRLLDRSGAPADLDALGMPEIVRLAFARLVARAHGMIVVTGPTGSGKTSTLYSALQLRSGATEKIVTVEDPVEYQLAGITQIPVHRQHGVSFAAALRAILRQDPDVVMIGEMRDAETAELGVQASLTGHLVLSTLHTNDAASAIPRLTDLGVPPYLLAATLEGVLAQRLVRRTCSHCRVEDAIDDTTRARFAEAPARLWKGVGCDECRGTGYRGRVGVFELLIVSDAMRAAIIKGAAVAELRAITTQEGASELEADAWQKVRAGITTIEEVRRVLDN